MYKKSWKSSTWKVDEHIPLGYWVPTIWAFDKKENKHDAYRGEQYIKKVFLTLKRTLTEDN